MNKNKAIIAISSFKLIEILANKLLNIKKKCKNINILLFILYYYGRPYNAETKKLKIRVNFKFSFKIV